MSACREVGGGVLKSIPYQPNVFNYFSHLYQNKAAACAERMALPVTSKAAASAKRS